MGERITVVGGSDSAIAVTLDGTQALRLANQFVSDLNNYYENNQLNFLNVTKSPNIIDGQIGYGTITTGGAYDAGNGYDYIVVGGSNKLPSDGTLVNPDTAELLDQEVIIDSAMTSGQFVRVLAGNITKEFTYNASQEGGQLAAGNISNSVIFNGNTVDGGNWFIATGQGNDTIVTGSGINTVNASTGSNYINITAGVRNQVTSEGTDSIYAAADSTAQNRVTLQGGISKTEHSTVSINSGASVTDIGLYNVVTVGGGSSIEGGGYGNYYFNGSNNSNMNVMSDGISSTIKAETDLQVIHGNSNTVTASQALEFYNGAGDFTANVGGIASGFGADGLNYTLNATGDNQGLFVADAGNETLNASGSTAGLQIYANTIVGGGNTNFVATGGSGNDTLIAGTGNSTFSGGTGENLFMFTKETAEEGNTVIRDFNQNDSKNTIALFNYGLDGNSLQALLNSSTNDTNGNAVLNLNGHTITIEGVSVSDLNVNQFMVANSGTQSS